MILLLFLLSLLGSTSGDTLLPTWQVPFTQTTVLPASRVGASGIFNGSGVLIVGGTVNTVSAQTVPMAPSSFYATGSTSGVTDLPLTDPSNLPRYGATVVPIPPEHWGDVPYQAYALFGDSGPTAGKEVNSVLGWTGSAWVTVPTSRDLATTVNAGVPPPRKLASGAFLYNCGGAGGKCIVIGGGWTEARGTTMTGGYLNTWILWLTASPTWQYVLPGVGSGQRLAPGMVASPDGTAVYVFGGDSGCTGAKTLGCTSNVMYVMSTVGFGGPSAYDLDSDPNAELALVSGCPTTGSITCTPAMQKATCQTSTWTTSVSSFGNDGTINTVFNPLHIGAHTNTERDPFFVLDLGSVMTSITRLKLWFRSDCCFERVSPFEIWYGTAPPSPTGFSCPPNGKSSTTLGYGPMAAGNQKLPNPYTDAVYSPLVFDLAPNDITARYFYIRSPGAARMQTFIEFQAFRRKPYFWRALGGSGTLGAGTAVAYLSSLYSSPTSLIGPASNAFDGMSTTAATTFEALSATNPLGVNPGIFWTLDLGRQYGVSYLTISGASDRSVSTAVNQWRNSRYNIAVGNSRDPTQCYNFFSGLSFDGVVGGRYSTPSNARFVHVWKTRSTNANPLQAAGENTLQLTEVSVFGARLTSVPPGLAGFASAAYGGYFVIWGGWDSSLTLRNTLYMFDMALGSWVPSFTPLGTLPVARSYATLGLFPTPQPPPRNVTVMVLFGGSSAAGPLGDTYRLEMPSCPPLSTAQGQLAFSTVGLLCRAGGAFCSYTCAAGYTHNNPSTGAVYCGMDGQWNGNLPLCLGTPPTLSTSPTLTSTATTPNVGEALVSWANPTTVLPPGVPQQVLSIETSPQGFTEYFNGAFEDTSVWTLLNGPSTSSLQSSYTFASTLGSPMLYMDAQQNSACTALLQNCLILLRTLPTTIPGLSAGGSWAYEAYVSFSMLNLQRPWPGGVYVGIGVYDMAKRSGTSMTGALEFIAGLTFDATLGVQVGYFPVTNPGNAQWVPTPTFQPGSNAPFAYIRVERLLGTGSWRVGYRFSPAESWTFFPAIPEASLLRQDTTPGVTLGDNGYTSLGPNIRLAIVSMSAGTSFFTSTRSYTLRASFFTAWIRWAILSPILPGIPRLLPYSPATTSAVIKGMTLGGSLSFTGVVENVFGIGALADPTGGGAVSPLSLPSAPSPIIPSNFDATLGKGTSGSIYATGASVSSFSYPLSCQALSSGGGTQFEGSMTTTTFTTNRATDNSILGSTAGCGTGIPASRCCSFTHTTGTQPDGDYLQIDLVVPTAVREVAVWNTKEPSLSSQLNNFQVFVGNFNARATNPYITTSLYTLNQRCDPTNVPLFIDASMSLPSYGPNIPASTFAARFPCITGQAVVGRFVTILVSPGSKVTIDEIKVFSASSCPPRTAVNGVQLPGSTCSAGSPLGATCVHSCATGYIQVSGATSSQCNGETWNDLPLVCQLPCDNLGAPNTGSTTAATCTNSLYANDFSNATSAFSLALVDLKVLPWVGTTSTVGVSDGVLHLSATPGFGNELHVVAMTRATFNYQNTFTWTTRFRTTGDRVGILWKVQDAGNMMRFVVNPVTGTHELQRINNGVVKVLISQAAPITIYPRQWYTLSVQCVNQYTHNIYLNDRLLLSSVDYYWTGGWAGVYAASYATFDDMAYQVDCTLAGFCGSSLAGSTCAFDCPLGMTPNGPTLQTCASSTGGGKPTWAPGGTLSCVMVPPTFPTAVISVPENALKNTPVGSPLQASSLSPGYSLTYILKAVYMWGNTSLPQPFPFYVDSCTGQVKVLTSACGPVGTPNCPVLNFEVCSLYYLQVAAVIPDGPLINGLPPQTLTNITLLLTNVDEQPTILPNTLLLPENSPPNTTVGMVPFFDPDTEASFMACSIVVGSSLFQLVNGTCTIQVSALGAVRDALNFESSTSTFTLQVFMYQTNLVSNTGLGSFTIQLTNVDDPPSITTTAINMDQAAASNSMGPPIIPLVLTTLSASSGFYDQDEASASASPTFAGALPALSLVPPSLQSSFYSCAPVPPEVFPTSLSTAMDPTPLFSMAANASSSFDLLLVAPPGSAATDWSNQVPFTYNQQVVRTVYKLCVNSTDSRGAWGTFGVSVLVVSNDTSTPRVVDITTSPTYGWQGTVDPNNLNTAGGDVLRILTANYGYSDSTGTWRPYPARMSISGSWGTFIGPQCTYVSTLTNVYDCPTPAGLGASVPPFTSTISFIFERLGIFQKPLDTSSASAKLVSYAPPVVSSLEQNTGLPTAGWGSISPPQSPTAIVIFRGTNFGPQVQSANASSALPYPTVRFGGGSQYKCLGFDPVLPTEDPQTVLRCRVGPGVGLNLPWSVSTDPQRPSVFNSTPEQGISYAPPAITSVSAVSAGVVDLTALLGRGGESFRVIGTNFGTDPEPFQLTFQGFVNKSAVSCSRDSGVAGNTGFVCVTPPNIGRDYTLVMAVGGQSSLPSSTLVSYAPPVITSISGPGIYRAATKGGAYVEISGVNLGPVNTIPDLVTYGHPPTDVARYTALNCITQVADTRINCTLAPGVGANLAWVVTLGGQPSSLYLANTSYSPPIINFFSGPGASSGDTLGGQTVVIQGQNFGPNDAYTNGLLSVYYDTTLQAPLLGGQKSITFLPSQASPCTITSDAVTESISCTTSPGAGYNLVWHVTMDGQVNIRPSTTYAPPVITALLDTAGNSLATIPGAPACPAPHPLQCGVAPVTPGDPTYTACLRTHLEAYISNCFCSLPPSSPLYDCTPFLYIDATTCPNTLATASTAMLTSPLCAASSLGGDTILLQGQFFGPTPYFDVTNNANLLASLLQGVTYGPSGVEYKAQAVVPSAGTGAASSGPQQLSITLAPGYGAGNYFRFTLANQRSTYANEASPPMFSFSPATINSLSPPTGVSSSSYPTYITVNASNVPLRDPRFAVALVFGNVLYQPDGSVVAGEACTPNCPNPWQTSQVVGFSTTALGGLTFSLPLGAGASRFVQVRVTNVDTGVSRYSPVTPGSLFSYANPAIFSVAVATARFVGYGSATASSPGALPCPFSPTDAISSPTWNCNNAALIQLTLTGSSFGSLNGASPTLSLGVDGVSKSLAVQPFSTGPLFSASDKTSGQLFLYSWSPSSIIAFSVVTNGTITVGLSTTGGNGGGGGTCLTSATPDSYGLLGFSGCTPNYPSTASGVFTSLGPQVNAFSWSPCVTSGPCTAPTTGSTLTLTVANLNPGDSVRVHVGNPALSSLPVCSLALTACPGDPANGYFGTGTIQLSGYSGISNPSTSAADIIAKHIAAGLSSVTFLVTPPPGQGSTVPVMVERITPSSTSDYSSPQGAVLRYASPTLATFDAVDPSGVTFLAGATAALFTQVAPLFTVGGSKVVFRGSNLGSFPSIYVGLSPSLTPASGLVSDCSGGGSGVGTCWSVSTPAGEGTGLLYPALFGPQTSTSSPSLNGLSSFYNTAQWGNWPGGYFAWLFAGDQYPAPLKAAYASPNATALLSPYVGGAIPSKGGVRVRVVGYNLGNPSVPPLPNAIAFAPFASATTLPSDWLLCASPARAVASGNLEGIDCTLPQGMAGAPYKVQVTVGDVVYTSTTPLFYYDTPPTLLYVAATDPKLNRTYDIANNPGVATLYPVRLPTDGGGLLVCASNWVVSKSPSIQVGLFSFTLVGSGGGGFPMVPASPPPSLSPLPPTSACYTVGVPAGQGSGGQYPIWRAPAMQSPGFYVQALSFGDSGNVSVVPFAYDLPVVTSLTSVTGSYPSEGGPLLWILGTNFGVPMSCNSTQGQPCLEIGQPTGRVAFGLLSDSAGFTPCDNMVRWNSSAISCNLPPGLGANLVVEVDAGDQTGYTLNMLTYDLPYLTSPPTITNFGAGGLMSTTSLASPSLCLQTTSFVNPATYPLPTPYSYPTYTSNFPILCDSTRGGSLITLRGANFGPGPSTPACVFLSIADRPLDPVSNGTLLAPVCNGVVDWLGEGEVPVANIVQWNNTFIAFVVPPGLGWKEIVVSVRGARLSGGPGISTRVPLPAWSPLTPYFRYFPPTITSVVPTLVGTNGATLVTVTGSNFGPPPAIQTSSSTISSSTTSSSFLSSSSAALPTINASTGFTTYPGAYIVVQWHLGCAASAAKLTAVGDVSAFWLSTALRPTLTDPTDNTSPTIYRSISNCTCQGQQFFLGTGSCTPPLVSITHDTIVFFAPPGIGVNRTLLVSVVEPSSIDYYPPKDPNAPLSAPAPPPVPLTRTGGSGVQGLQLQSNALTVGYLPPSISTFYPTVISIDATLLAALGTNSSAYNLATQSVNLEMQGLNFGLASTASAQGWTGEERKLEALVGGVPCASVTRQDQVTITGALSSYLVCALDARGQVVGFPPVSIKVAGQSASVNPTDRRTALLVTCKQGSYGHFGETCNACPTCAGGIPCADCKGFTKYPDAPFTTKGFSAAIVDSVLIVTSTSNSMDPGLALFDTSGGSTLAIPPSTLTIQAWQGLGTQGGAGIYNLTISSLTLSMYGIPSSSAGVGSTGFAVFNASFSNTEGSLVMTTLSISPPPFLPITPGMGITFSPPSSWGSAPTPPLSGFKVGAQLNGPAGGRGQYAFSITTPATSLTPTDASTWPPRASLPVSTLSASITYHWYDTPLFPQQFHYPEPIPGYFNLNSSDAFTASKNYGAMTCACPVGSIQGGFVPTPLGNPLVIPPQPCGNQLANPGETFFTETFGSSGKPGVQATGLVGYVGRRDVCIVPCEPKEACLGNNYCAVGYVSKPPMFRCASCAPGYFSSAGSCIPCPNSPVGIVVVVCLVLMGIAGLTYWLNKNKVNIAVMSIGIDFFQVLAIFAQLKIAWPPAIKTLFSILSAFNLNIEIVAPECLLPTITYVQKWGLIVGLPFLLAGIFGVVFLVSVAKRYLVNGVRVRRELWGGSDFLVAGVLILSYLFYLYMCRTIVEVFNCVPTSPPDGNLYLSSTFEQCTNDPSTYIPGSSQARLFLPALAGIVLIMFGYPATVGYILYRSRELVMEDQLLRAKGVGNDKLTNPNALEFRTRFGRSYFQFKPQWYLWILVILARKCAIAVTALFNKSASFQMAACLLVIFVAYTAQVQVHPYMSPSEYDDVLKRHEELAATDPLHARLKATVSSIASTGKKVARKNLLNSVGEVEKGAVLGILRGWLFNYNTVEAVMLFATVVVCAMALMYQTASLNTQYSSALDGITSVIILTVSLAIIYYVTVLVTEIAVLGTANGRLINLKKTGKGMLTSSRPSGDFDPGVMSTQVNPNFLKARVGGGDGSPGKNGSDASSPGAFSTKDLLEAIKATKEAPSEDMWRKFQTALGDLKDVVSSGEEDLRALLQEEKSAELESRMAMDSGSLAVGNTARKVIRNEVAGGIPTSPLRASRGGGGGGGGVSDSSPFTLNSNPLLASRRSTSRGGGGSGSSSSSGGGGGAFPISSASTRGLAAARTPSKSVALSPDDIVLTDSPLRSSKQ